MNYLTYSNQTNFQPEMSQQLKRLTDKLKRIASICNDANNLNSAIELILESQRLIERAAPMLMIDDAAELVALGRILAEWKFRWIEISCDQASLLNVQNLAQTWHKRLCEG